MVDGGHNLQSFLVGAGAAVPKQAPPWFASQEQYETFQKLFATDVGAQCITTTSIDVPHLDEDDRKQALSNRSLRSTLQLLCSTYARLDAAALFGREAAFEKKLVAPLQGDLANKVRGALAGGSRIIPPSALNQLIREAIEWCADGDAADDLGPISTVEFVHMVLSINGDQEAQDRPDFFTTWPPTQDELIAFNDAMTHDDDLVLEHVRRHMLVEFARAHTNSTPVPQAILALTYDTWFKAWPDAAPHSLIGDSPEQAFKNSTNVPLRDVVRMGLHIWGHTKAGAISLDIATLKTFADAAALNLLKSTAVLSVKEYRKRLKKERAQGFLAHRRYTFTERPIIQLDDENYIVLRPAWVLDRFCGSQLYWQTFAQFGFEKTPAGEQFSLAINYVFESTVGYLFRRAARRARPTITLITEAEMQQAWTKGGITPSVCDWVLVSGNSCALIDATNVWLDANAAQGLSDPDEYQADLEETFINKKFEQLKSTRQLLIDNGWEGCTFNDTTIYTPIVVVPNTGIPASVFADIDVKLRTGQLAPNMLAAGVLTYHELEVFEGITQHRAPQMFVGLLARWRLQCTTPMPMRLQTFLDISGFDRPRSTYMGTANSLLIKKIGPPIPQL
ncbi:hypothetical protein Mycch_3861 [Mycolicibacterium chubuense NBB4]|uniref:Uncharacterized protein n=1 Tax=Mycolicibacterium chubuense (strain NBB4) TaxID=710421 RepID=I4BMS9_MYCCN|nr:hypothetical protein [Mycolicibacterium chubuense]AFM18586.1 hypothetical protein Mycch_3861 [Mycolicibacterium chubuense NBB4]